MYKSIIFLWSFGLKSEMHTNMMTCKNVTDNVFQHYASHLIYADNYCVVSINLYIASYSSDQSEGLIAISNRLYFIA